MYTYAEIKATAAAAAEVKEEILMNNTLIHIQ